MRRRITWKMRIFFFLMACLLGGGSAALAAHGATQQKVRDPEKPRARLTEQVRHELAMLPWYGVFDNLAFRVDGDRVTLMGQVIRPSIRSDAENVVKRIEGVASVKNDIEVLPASFFDDGIRVATYRAIYGHTGLQKYGVGSLRAIHIIVKNGHVTLEGTVLNEMDRNVAGIQANSVPNVFSVKNNLRVEKG